MSHEESLEEFQARFSSQFSAEQQKVLFKQMLEEQPTSASKKTSETCPSTPPPTQQSKRSLQSPITPYRGGSRKVLIS
jgi:hypothetical protein